jgi:hypothetical protein
MLRAVVAVSGAALFVLFVQGVSEAPDARTARPVTPAVAERPAPPTLPSVRIEHEFVRVPLAPPAPRPVVRPLVSSPQARLQRRPEPQTHSRAYRMLFGDGTYRPEPFPRPSRD